MSNGIQYPESAEKLRQTFLDLGLRVYVGPVHYATGRNGVSISILTGANKEVASFCFMDTGELLEIDTEARHLTVNEEANYPSEVNEQWLIKAQEIVLECKNHLYTTQDASRIKDMVSDLRDIELVADTGNIAINKDHYFYLRNAVEYIQRHDCADLAKNKVNFDG